MNGIFDRVKENEKLNSFLNENKDMLVKVAAAALVAVVAFLFFVFRGSGEADIKIEDAQQISASDTEQKEKREQTLFVDIGGEVKEPKLVELPEGSRIEDAVRAAGGLTDDADIEKINRAAFVSDGEKILIPSKIGGHETEMQEEVQTGAYSYSDGRININTADASKLEELDGIGPVTAEKIISYREENGGFSSIDDIKNVSGIGDKTFEKFKEDITV